MLSSDVRRSRVYTTDTSQKYVNEEFVDKCYMNEATDDWSAVY